jgi:hypothetical protein
MPQEKSSIVVCLSLVSHYVKILTIFLLVLKYCNFTNCPTITWCIHVNNIVFQYDFCMHETCDHDKEIYNFEYHNWILL